MKNTLNAAVAAAVLLSTVSLAPAQTPNMSLMAAFTCENGRLKPSDGVRVSGGAVLLRRGQGVSLEYTCTDNKEHNLELKFKPNTGEEISAKVAPKPSKSFSAVNLGDTDLLLLKGHCPTVLDQADLIAKAIGTGEKSAKDYPNAKADTAELMSRISVAKLNTANLSPILGRAIAVSLESLETGYKPLLDIPDEPVAPAGKQTIVLNGIASDGILSLLVDNTEVDRAYIAVSKPGTTTAGISATQVFLIKPNAKYKVSENAEGKKVIASRTEQIESVASVTGMINTVFDDDFVWGSGWLPKLLTLGLYSPSRNRLGLSLGAGVGGSNKNMAMLGVSWYLDREASMAITYGIYFRPEQRLKPGFFIGNETSLTDSDITFDKIGSGFYVGFSFKAGG